MTKLLVAFVVLTSCVSTPEYTENGEAILYPESYGGTADDGVDDRVAIQSAINEGCGLGKATVRLGPGTWNLTKAGPGAYNLRAALSWHCAGVSLEGDGISSTVLRLTGDMSHSASWPISLDPGASGSRLSRFTVDTSGTWNEDESSHAINIGSSICAGVFCAMPVEDITVEEVAVIHPPATDGTRKGDCLHVFGNTVAGQAKNIKFRGLSVYECARSGLAMQRNANFITVTDSYFNGCSIGDTMVDGEATGGEGQTGLVFSNNTLAHFCTAAEFHPANYGLALTTQTNCQITNNTLIGRGINLYRGTDCVFANNSIDVTDMQADVGAFDLGNNVTRVAIANNTFRRRGGPGSLIKVRHASGHGATGIVISGNVGTNETDGASVFLDSAQSTTVGLNAFTGNTGRNSMGIYVTCGLRNCTSLAINGNSLDSMGYAGIRLDPTPGYTFYGVTVGLNVVTGSGPGLRCDDPLRWFPGALTRGLNNYNTAEMCLAP
jgi:hypothetical protein